MSTTDQTVNLESSTAPGGILVPVYRDYLVERALTCPTCATLRRFASHGKIQSRRLAQDSSARLQAWSDTVSARGRRGVGDRVPVAVLNAHVGEINARRSKTARSDASGESNSRLS